MTNTMDITATIDEDHLQTGETTMEVTRPVGLDKFLDLPVDQQIDLSITWTAEQAQQLIREALQKAAGGRDTKSIAGWLTSAVAGEASAYMDRMIARTLEHFPESVRADWESVSTHIENCPGCPLCTRP